MRNILFVFLFLCGLFTVESSAQNFGLVIHGGAGSISPETVGEREGIYREALENALNVGYQLLEEGVSAGDVVERVIVILEDNPLFNAGKGAVLNKDGDISHDASFMDGRTQNAGAIAAVFLPKNPIRAARLVMDSSKHVMLIGVGAEDFCRSQQLELLSAVEKEGYRKVAQDKRLSKKGTVGCVVMDKDGNLAAGTSTGGTVEKLPGRVGDSPIIGAGTWADNRSCAVSATGVGEYFMRTVAAYQVAAAMLYGDIDLYTAMKSVMDEIKELGGDGGLIAIDKNGQMEWVFNTSGMFRAKKSNTTKAVVEMYGE